MSLRNAGKSQAVLCFLLVAIGGPALAGGSDDATAARALINRHCVFCHNDKLTTAGVNLQTLDTVINAPNTALWEKVLRKVESSQMPPVGLPRPKPEATAAFTKWLTVSLDAFAAAHPNPGHATIHRLNRAEYSNAIRDLLALDVNPGAKLPPDDTGYGFDNIGDVLSMSPILVERYISAARLVSRLAVGDTAVKPEVNEFTTPRDRTAKRVRASEELPFDSAGGLLVNYHFPVDADYDIKVKLPPVIQGFDAPSQMPRIIEMRLPMKAGNHRVGATFLAENLAPETLGSKSSDDDDDKPPAVATARMDVRIDGVRVKLYDVEYSADHPQLKSVTIAGPYNVVGPGETPSRQKIFLCKPENASQETPCAAKILTNLGRRAYRRPFTASDLKPLLAFYERGRQDGSFELGIGAALRAMLVSPDFLFRVERDAPQSAPGAVHRITDLELASRLSFFLWSSIPDEELLQLAEQGKLKDQAVLTGQVDRMLADHRSTAFVSNFAGQWLFLRNLAKVTPDPDTFPQFDAGLARAFQHETELFFDSVLREDRPVTDLVTANFTFLNQRLAQLYEIPNVYGSQFRKVNVDGNRGGLLGQGSILTVTSYPNRTSVVQRGKWVLENLLGGSPPPPPADVPTLEGHAKDGRILTAREQMEQHRANPTCAGCHSRMDPIGFSLENYNGIGAWRAKDGTNAIDVSGKLPDGTSFDGPKGLRSLLATEYRSQFITTFTEKLMTYALGRGVEYYDGPAVREIVRTSKNSNYQFAALIGGIVTSTAFRMRKLP
ncbi:MAG: DUF1592 domain-containing protein [Bryobacteraceae bacterium]